MDRFGSFDQHDSYDSGIENDAGIEAPPAIGTDERRMHVRAYNYWVSLLDGRAYPSIEDLEPQNNDDFGPHSVLLDFSTGAETPAIAYLGDALRLECGLPDDVETIAEVPARSLLSRLTDHYLQIIANRAPIGFEAEFVNNRGNNTMYRGILMPYSSDDDTIDFIFGVINWKEVADDQTVAGIADELEQARVVRGAHDDAAPVAAWADGPGTTPSVANEAPAYQAPVINAPVFAAPVISVPARDELRPSFDEELVDPNALDELDQFEPDGSEGLGDWLAVARDFASAARTADMRSRTALYKAISLAYDFALVAETKRADYAELLEESGISQQDRAPMTPIVKLVFGIDYDKTRLAEFAAVLGYAKQIGVGRGGLEARIESFSGGIKGILAAARAGRRPAATAAVPQEYARVRGLPSIGIVDLPGDSEFVLLVARRVDAERVAILGTPCGDGALLERALKQLNR